MLGLAMVATPAERAPLAGSAPAGTDGAQDEPTQVAEADLAPGTLIADRYRVDRKLGEGGMGAVYAAEHVAMKKIVALKVLHQSSSRSAEIVQRFEREAIAAAAIDHQHVATATDFGKLPSGGFFLVLEYVDGRNLREELTGLLPVARALRILRGVASGLAAAHARGIVHRDLKPENVMLTERDGNPDFVKVLDFGIAKIDESGPVESTQGGRALTRVGAIMGTPSYMSPEQAVGQPCDARADVYALGILFYELCTGAPPFEGDPLSVLTAQVTTPAPPWPDTIAAALGPLADEVLSKMLAKAPTERYQDAGEVLTALEALGAHASPAPPAAQSAVKDLSLTTDEAVVRAAIAAPTLAVSLLPGLTEVAQKPPESRSVRMLYGALLAAAIAGLLIALLFAVRGPSPAAITAPPALTSATPAPSSVVLPALPSSTEVAPAPSTDSSAQSENQSKKAGAGKSTESSGAKKSSAKKGGEKKGILNEAVDSLKGAFKKK